jgi:acyl-coenzyme A thioesterase PaaI-like protein
MDQEKRKVRTRRGTRDYTYRGCPLTRNRSAWCFRLCVPDEEGRGFCGRVAPHGLQGQTAASIERHNKEKLAAHCRSLEHMYLHDERRASHDSGIHVDEGGAEIVMPVQDHHLLAGDALDTAICFALLNDAASLAVNSVVEDVLVRAEQFGVHFTHATPKGQLIARGHLLCANEEELLAESVVVDSEGTEIARGNGAFVKCDVALSAEMGYESATGAD